MYFKYHCIYLLKLQKKLKTLLIYSIYTEFIMQKMGIMVHYPLGF